MGQLLRPSFVLKGKNSGNKDAKWDGFLMDKNTRQNRLKFPIAPMGVLAPGSAHARPSAQPPIDTSGNFSAQVSGRRFLATSEREKEKTPLIVDT